MISYSSPGYLYNEQQLLLGSKNICCAVLCRALIKTFINKTLVYKRNLLFLCMYFSTHTLNFVRQPAFGTRWTRKQILINIQRYEKDRQTNEQSCSVVIAKIKGKHIRKTYTGNLFCLFAIACCFWSLSIMLFSYGDITVVSEGAGPPNSDLCFVLRPPPMTRDIHFSRLYPGIPLPIVWQWHCCSTDMNHMIIEVNQHYHRTQPKVS